MGGNEAMDRSSAQQPSSAERIRTVCLVLIAVCTVGAALYFLRDILTPLLISLFLFFLIKPLADAFGRWRWPVWLSYTLFCILLVVVVYITGRVVQANVESFQHRLPEYRQHLIAIGRDIGRLTGQANVDAEEKSIGELFDFTWKEVIQRAFGTVVGFVETLVMVVFYLLFLFLEAQHLPLRVQAAYSPESADKFLRIGSSIQDGINGYLVVKTAVSLGLGITTGLLGYLFGLDFWPLWGVLMFVANYVTYVGSIVALVPPIMLAYLQFESPVAATVFAVLLVAIRFFWIDYVEIRSSGKHLNISPLLLLVSLAVFGWLWGVVGMVLAVPLVTITKIILLNFENTRHWGTLISEK
jgi:predicted PurR-regulated permease PerM